MEPYLRDWLNRRQAALSPKTAERCELIRKNPARLAEGPRRRRAQVEVWSEGQVLLFLSEARDHSPYYPLYLFLAATGCRLGEALALRWPDVNLAEGEVVIRSTLVRPRGGGYLLKAPKTHSSGRVVGLPGEVVALLKADPRDRWIERLETEHDNLRSALKWSKAEKDGAEAGLRLVGALHRFWFRRGHWREASEWLEGALARSDEAAPSLRPKALTAAAHFAWRLGDYGLATTLGEKGVALCRELGDKEANAALLTTLSVVTIHQGNYDRAMALCEEALNLGRDLGNKAIIGMQFAHVGIVARYVGDYERAAALQSESLALFREIGDKSNIAFVLRNLGRVALHRNDCGQAAGYFRESVILCREIGETWLSEECLEGLAGVATGTRQYERAARLLGAAEELREILGWHPSPPDQADYDECTATTRAALGNTAFSVAWAEGRAMTLEQAIECALSTDSTHLA